MNDLRYPIGKAERKETLTPAERQTLIGQIADAPANMRRVVAGLNDAQLDTPYREGGWSVRQVVHHVPDSHLNSYCRFKLALTRGDADDPPVRRSGMGGPRRLARDADRDVARPARVAPRSLGAPAPLHARRRLRPPSPPSRARRDVARLRAVHLRMAQPASRRAHHDVAGEDGVVTDVISRTSRSTSPARSCSRWRRPPSA